MGCSGSEKPLPQVRYSCRSSLPITEPPCASPSTPTKPPPRSARIQAVRCGDTVYMSGQIPIDPATGELVAGDIAAQARRAFDNLGAVCEADAGSLDDVARVGLSLSHPGQFAGVNAGMAAHFNQPSHARSPQTGR